MPPNIGSIKPLAKQITLSRSRSTKGCNLSNFRGIFQNVLNKYAPLKQKKARGNHAPFMTKDLSKAIMNKSKTRNRYLKWPSRENLLTMKVQNTSVTI